jgi:hypothetical protein
MLPATLEGAVALPLAPGYPLPIGLGMRSQELATPSARRFIRVAEAWAQARGEGRVRPAPSPFPADVEQVP